MRSQLAPRLALIGTILIVRAESVDVGTLRAIERVAEGGRFVLGGVDR